MYNIKLAYCCLLAIGEKKRPDLYSTTDAGVEHQFMLAEVQLCNEGIGKRYADKYEDDIDDNTVLYDVILYVADEHQRDKRMDYAKKRFFELADAYRSKTKTVTEEYRKKYNGLVTQSSEVSPPLLFHLPDNINVDLDVDGEPCTDHLFVNAEGTATFNLNTWEQTTLKEERLHGDYCCWLRNQDRKPWALCIPYKMGDEIHRMFPDFLVVRKKANGNYDYALLEPHRDDKKDNLAKARGLIDYVEKCPSEVAGDYVIWPDNHMALVKDEAYFRCCHKEIEKHPEVETVFLITDSQSAYLSMVAELKGMKTYQLYRDYLENFRINYAVK